MHDHTHEGDRLVQQHSGEIILRNDSWSLLQVQKKWGWKRAAEREVCSWNLLCLLECASATPSSLLPLCRSRQQPLVRRPLKLPCFDRCSLCPNASQRTLWRLSHSPSRSLFSFFHYSLPSLTLPSFAPGFLSNEENHCVANVHNVRACS